MCTGTTNSSSECHSWVFTIPPYLISSTTISYSKRRVYLRHIKSTIILLSYRGDCSTHKCHHRHHRACKTGLQFTFPPRPRQRTVRRSKPPLHRGSTPTTIYPRQQAQSVPKRKGFYVEKGHSAGKVFRKKKKKKSHDGSTHV